MSRSPMPDPTSDGQLSDDELVARLRRATADVPASTLDLDAVLRSSRRKTVRHRAAATTGCVAALAVAGVGAQQLPALHGERGAGGPATTATTIGPAGPASACVPRLVDVSWGSETVAPIVMWADRVVVVGEDPDVSLATERTVAFDPRAADPSVDGQGISSEMADGVVARAREDARNPPPMGTYFASPGSGTERSPFLEGLEAAWRGVAATQVPEVAGEIPGPLDPGTYVFYAEGRAHEAEGVATCEGEKADVALTYWEPVGEPVALACADPAKDDVAVHVKRAYCPGDLSAAERAVIGLDPADADSVRTVELVAGQLRLPWTR